MIRFVSGHGFSRAVARRRIWALAPVYGRTRMRCRPGQGRTFGPHFQVWLIRPRGSRTALPTWRERQQGLKPCSGSALPARLKPCPDTWPVARGANQGRVSVRLASSNVETPGHGFSRALEFVHFDESIRRLETLNCSAGLAVIRFVSGHGFSRAVARRRIWALAPVYGRTRMQCQPGQGRTFGPHFQVWLIRPRGSRTALPTWRERQQGLKPCSGSALPARLKPCPDTRPVARAQIRGGFRCGLPHQM